jgi:hypothetical protein
VETESYSNRSNELFGDVSSPILEGWDVVDSKWLWKDFPQLISFPRRPMN